MNMNGIDGKTVSYSDSASIGVKHSASSVNNIGEYGLGYLVPKVFNTRSLSEEERTKLDEKLKQFNEAIESSGKRLRFKYNDEAKQLYVEVLDAKTEKVLASMPPEFIIDLSIKMKELIGMFFDKKI